MRTALDILAASLLFAPLLYAALRDFRAMEIPNWVSLLIAVGFMVFAANHWGELLISYHLIVAGTLFAITFVFWWMGWLGGGDVKLLSAVGLWLGPGLSLPFIFILAVVSSALSVLLIIVRRAVRERDTSGLSASMHRVTEIARTGACPYGIPICLAACATLPKMFL